MTAEITIARRADVDRYLCGRLREGLTIQQMSDYSASLPGDAICGEERRITTTGISVATDQPLEPPLVSVITITYNSEAHLERTIQSVLAQTYPNIEYILIDGGSSDGTLDIIRSHADQISYWHSKPDKGISDAFNMGVAVSRGEYVGLVNSDDWMEPAQISEAMRVLQETEAAFAYGDLVMHSAAGDSSYRVKGDPNYSSSIRYRMPLVNHPTFVASREIYQRIGLFDMTWRVAMDYDWVLRAHLAGFIGRYVPDLCGNMTLDGASDAGWWRGLDEVRRIAISHRTPLWTANASFCFSFSRSVLRRLIELLIPASLTLRIRSAMNSAVIPIAPDDSASRSHDN